MKTVFLSVLSIVVFTALGSTTLLTAAPSTAGGPLLAQGEEPLTDRYREAAGRILGAALQDVGRLGESHVPHDRDRPPAEWLVCTGKSHRVGVCPDESRGASERAAPTGQGPSLGAGKRVRGGRVAGRETARDTGARRKRGNAAGGDHRPDRGGAKLRRARGARPGEGGRKDGALCPTLDGLFA